MRITVDQCELVQQIHANEFRLDYQRTIRIPREASMIFHVKWGCSWGQASKPASQVRFFPNNVCIWGFHLAAAKRNPTCKNCCGKNRNRTRRLAGWPDGLSASLASVKPGLLITTPIERINVPDPRDKFKNGHVRSDIGKSIGMNLRGSHPLKFMYCR